MLEKALRLSAVLASLVILALPVHAQESVLTQKISDISPNEKFAMRIWLDPSKLSAYNLTALDIQNALNRENVELPSGKIAGNEFLIKRKRVFHTQGERIEDSTPNEALCVEGIVQVTRTCEISC